jgi:acyl-CoA ligase (AMP-forming) (exosortase A-associated)
MNYLVQHLLQRTAETHSQHTALVYRDASLSYAELNRAVDCVTGGLQSLAEIKKYDRVAVFLEKRFEYVIAMFAALNAGAIFVPINPLLKPAQVRHILSDAGVSALVTTAPRHALLQSELAALDNAPAVIEVDAAPVFGAPANPVDQKATNSHALTEGERASKNAVYPWPWFMAHSAGVPVPTIDDDTAAILYTSGSTGSPKGVVLSHRNMVLGAHSVASYLNNSANDRLLAVLPFSFDYGLSQLTTAFSVGASVVLFNYFFPGDVVRALEREKITGLAAVPPLWNQLSKQTFPSEVRKRLRYITNSGGAMPLETLERLRQTLPNTQVYLMYGLTEAFRSTYLPPDEVDQRPESMGRAIPNAEIRIVDPEGNPVPPGGVGELVHCGGLVAKGYWNDPERTASRFRTVPDLSGGGGTIPAVWSGDTVRIDEEGYLYFIGREDEMIKTSGYRISPTEIEAVLHSSGWVSEAVAFSIPDPKVGQTIVALVSGLASDRTIADLDGFSRREMPLYMVPSVIAAVEEMPRNPNGKIDRKRLQESWEATGEKSVSTNWDNQEAS